MIVVVILVVIIVVAMVNVMSLNGMAIVQWHCMAVGVVTIAFVADGMNAPIRVASFPLMPAR